MVNLYQGAADPPTNLIPSMTVDAGNGANPSTLSVQISVITNGCNNPVRIEYIGDITPPDHSKPGGGQGLIFSADDPTDSARLDTFTRYGSVHLEERRALHGSGFVFNLSFRERVSGGFTLSFSADWARRRGYRSCYVLIPSTEITTERSPIATLRGGDTQILVGPGEETIPLILNPAETYPRIDDPFQGVWRCHLGVDWELNATLPAGVVLSKPCPGGYAAAAEPGAAPQAVRGGVLWGTALGVALAFAAQILLDPLLTRRRKSVSD
jgi:hypothetical protein